MAPNILWLLSDQHRADVMGCAGHPVVRTPNLDELAAAGTRYDSAYCQGPLCMPSRASLLTGRYVHEHGVLDNKTTMNDLPTIVQKIRDAGYHTATIGKMHLYPHRADVADGLRTMHGYGFEYVNEIAGKLASRRVRSAYTDYLEDRGLLGTYREFVASGAPMWAVRETPLPPDAYIDTWVAREASNWIGQVSTDRPFFLWVGFPGPHNPWDAPAEYAEQYRDADIELDTTRKPELPEDGPLRAFLERFLAYSSSDTATEDRIREVRRRYFANVTLIDAGIGRILAALRRRGLDQDTWVVYSTDHGEMLGTHSLFNKMVFYEPSVKVPLIVRPPGGGEPAVNDDLTQHIDLSATLTYPLSTGHEFVLSENFGFAMRRTDRFKLVTHEPSKLPVQLFDLEHDPQENHNVIADPSYAEVIAWLANA
jgi:choline-sulfatase